MNYDDQIVNLTNEEATLHAHLINKINENIPRINKIDGEFISRRGEIEPTLVAAAIRKLAKYATDAPNAEAQSMTQQINHAKKTIAKINTVIPEEMTNEQAIATLELLDQVLRHCRSFEKKLTSDKDYEVFSLLDKIGKKLESVRSELTFQERQPLNDLWKQLHRRSSKTYTVDYQIRCTFSYESEQFLEQIVKRCAFWIQYSTGMRAGEPYGRFPSLQALLIWNFESAIADKKLEEKLADC